MIQPEHMHDVQATQARRSDDVSAYRVALSFPTDNAAAGGAAANVAEAKVTLDSQLEPGIPVTFQIISGSAVFRVNGLQTLAGQSTGPMGRVDVSFTDPLSESGDMIAWMTDSPTIKSDKERYTFAGAAGSTYDLVLKPTIDGAPADGTSEDRGCAVVTENGGALQAPKIVKFAFGSAASARFDTTKPAGYVQPNSSSTVLYVKTHFDNDAQKDVADAYFTDNRVEAVTLIACLEGEPETKPQTQGFEFTAPRSYFLGLSSMTPDGVPSDGLSENLGRAIVSCDGSGLSAPQTVKFELQGEGVFDTRGADVLPNSTGSTLYVKTHHDGRQDVAYAYFTAPWPGTTTLQAALPDHPEVEGRSVDFMFRSPPWPYAVALSSLTLDGVLADGKSENHAQVVVTYGGKPMGHTLVTFELDGAWGAKFDTNRPYVQSSSANTMTVSTYTDEQGRDVADAYFTDSVAERVVLKASIPEYTRQGTSPAWRYFFFTTSGDDQR